MLVLEWRLTLLALVAAARSSSSRPSGSAGGCRRITRERMDLNASMNTTMTERFNVAGRPAREAVRPPRRRGRRVRATGPAGSATSACAAPCTAGRSSSPSASSAPSAPPLVYWLGGQLVISGAITLGTLVALAAYVTRIYAPLTSLTNARVDVHDRVRVVRPGLRGARHARTRSTTGPAPSTSSTRRAASSSTTCGSATRPPPRSRSPRSRATATRRSATEAVGARCCGASTVDASSPASSSPWSARRAPARPRSSSLVPRLYDVTDGRGAHRRPRRARPHPGQRCARPSAWSARTRTCSTTSIARQPALRPARRHRRRARGGLPGGPDPRRDRRAARRLRHRRRRAGLPAVGRREAAAGHRPHAAEGPGDRHPRRGHQPPRLRERGARPAGAGRRRWPGRTVARHRPPAVDDRRPPTRSSCSTRAASSSGAPTTSCSAAGGLYADLYRTLVARPHPPPPDRSGRRAVGSSDGSAQRRSRRQAMSSLPPSSAVSQMTGALGGAHDLDEERRVDRALRRGARGGRGPSRRRPWSRCSARGRCAR